MLLFVLTKSFIKILNVRAIIFPLFSQSLALKLLHTSIVIARHVFKKLLIIYVSTVDGL